MSLPTIERNQRLSQDQREKIGAQLAREYDRGGSLSQLAEFSGLSVGRVRTILLERGVVMRSRGGNNRHL